MACSVGGELSSGSDTFNSTPQWKYHVFLSFAGKDTRLNFTGHLYEAFSRSGFRCFRDDVDLERGEDINYIFQAIQDSLCAVLVISKNYAKSTWCLDELIEILESQNTLGRRVFPIFYNVNPADVRHQRESFGEALAELEKEFEEDTTKVQNWRIALSKIGNIAGLDTRGKYEADLVKNIVGDVWRFLSTKLPSFDDNLVGIDSKVADMIPFLEIWSDDKRFVGIWGMAGVGKTTLARVVFEKLSHEFEICCFLEKVKDALPKGLVSLQKRLLSHLKIKDLEIDYCYEGKLMIRNLLCEKKILLVIDDIDDMSQLEYLAGSPDWFGKGSRIIITTRNRHVLTSIRVKRIYEMKTLETDESLEIFSKKAFSKNHPEEKYLKYSKSLVKYVGGLPLALQALGSQLCERSEEAVWREALDKLKKINHHKNILQDLKILQVLKISYDGLNEKEQTIFLDIVCLFKGWEKEEVTKILKGCDLNPILGIKVLIEKTLLVETEGGRLDIHDLYEDLGWYIIQQKFPNGRLRKFEEIKEVLEHNKESAGKIEAIVMKENWTKDKIEVHPKAFSKMSRLRLLLLNCPPNVPMGLEKLSGALKFVRWPSFPLEALPLPLDELVHIEMPRSNIKQLWNGIKSMHHLKFINLSDSPNFTETPDFSNTQSLEYLCLSSCASLVKVHESLGVLKGLVEVNLRYCENLYSLPSKLETNSLRKLDLGWCKNVKNLPEFGEGMKELSHLDASHSAITRLPESLGSLTGLRWLNLSATGLINLPTNCFSGLFGLDFLSLAGCERLVSLPRLPPQPIRLEVDNWYSMKRKDRTLETTYNVEGESSSTSNTLNSTPQWKYDVFLSFAEKDTRLNFTGHLYEAFSRSGITCFRDDLALQRGEDINSLFQAIEDSLCAVLFISKSYAKSTRCLDELQKILESPEKLGRRVFPIFYNVNPADVREQRESFGEALATLEKKFKENTTKVQNWRIALSNIGNLSGWVTRDKHEAELVKNIVGDVWSFLSTKLPSFDDNLVGIDSKVADVIPFLEIGLDDKRFVGIWGMDGVGKTTLARVVFEKLSDKFEICCFLENVKDALPNGLLSLQKRLLSHLKIKVLEIDDRYEGRQMIRSLLHEKKVLLVIDNIDDMRQLEYLAESPDWFGRGSRVIITTRNKHLLASFGEEIIYKMKTMENDESLQLFSNKAFKKDHPEEGYWELSKSVIEYAGGLPLALKVLGSHFFGRSEAEWIDTLNRLKNIPDNDILQVLETSYYGLNEGEKKIFLDIACFFKGWRKKEVTRILKSCDFHPTIGIKVLIEKALLVETEDCRLEMHDLIEELGKYIVLQESPNDAGKRSRLWKFKDIKEVLENNKGSKAIQAIASEDKDWYQGRIEVEPEAFSKMSSIRLLLLEYTKTDSPLILPRGFKLPGTLKVVQWPSFPFEALPLETPLNELVCVKMQNSKIKQLWNVVQPTKMKFIDVSDSEYFIETPDFSRVPCLEHLRLRSCKSLVKVHPSLGELKELVEVDLHGCLNLEILPRKLKTNSLLKLDLGGCEKVVVLPKFGKGMEELSYLDVSGTAITRLPESFGSLTDLRYLNLMGCKICNLEKFSLKVMPLTELYLGACGLNDGSILDGFGCLSSLIILNLGGNDFVNLPTDCFSSLSRLLFLSLAYCKKLKSLPRLPPRLIRLNASHCDSLEPLSLDRQLWNLVASLDHEDRGQTEYVISEEEYDETPPIFKHRELEHLPLRDFFAIVPGCKIPSWFPDKYVHSSLDLDCEFEIELKIPPCVRDREWFGIVVCLHLSDDFDGVISWSSKAPEDDDYIHKEWVHLSTIRNGQNRHLRIMVLELDEKTCWQYLKAGRNSLHIKLYVRNQGSNHIFSWRTLIPVSLECGWRVICKEEIQEWCNENDLNQLTPPQLAPPHDKVKLPSRLLDNLYGSAYAQW